jgi:hypothetical protein
MCHVDPTIVCTDNANHISAVHQLAVERERPDKVAVRAAVGARGLVSTSVV